MDSGIYLLHNSRSGRHYVGSAVSVSRRWQEHRKTLRNGRHKNPHLQAAWDKYGEESFSFLVVCQCPVETLIAEEQDEIDFWVGLCGKRKLYNIDLVAGSRLGFRHSDATKSKISESLRGKPGRGTGTKRSEEFCQRMRARVCRPESKAKMAAAKLGVKRKPFTEETRKRMSEAAKRRTPRKQGS